MATTCVFLTVSPSDRFRLNKFKWEEITDQLPKAAQMGCMANKKAEPFGSKQFLAFFRQKAFDGILSS